MSLSEGTFVPCLGWDASREKSGWHLNSRGRGRAARRSTALEGWAASGSSHPGVCGPRGSVASWGPCLNGGPAGAGHRHADRMTGSPQKGINRLRMLSSWKVVLTLGLWDQNPDSTGFICCRIPIISRLLAAPLGSFC